MRTSRWRRRWRRWLVSATAAAPAHGRATPRPTRAGPTSGLLRRRRQLRQQRADVDAVGDEAFDAAGPQPGGEVLADHLPVRSQAALAVDEDVLEDDGVALHPLHLGDV